MGIVCDLFSQSDLAMLVKLSSEMSHRNGENVQQYLAKAREMYQKAAPQYQDVAK